MCPEDLKYSCKHYLSLKDKLLFLFQNLKENLNMMNTESSCTQDDIQEKVEHKRKENIGFTREIKLVSTCKPHSSNCGMM